MNPNPLNGQMSIKDAAIVATFLMLATLFTLFFPSHTYDLLLADYTRYLFDLAVFAGSSWLTNFGLLSGLSKYAQRATEG